MKISYSPTYKTYRSSLVKSMMTRTSLLGFALLSALGPAFADDSWGCMSQEFFWDRVEETLTKSEKAQEINLTGLNFGGGFDSSNNYHKSLHIFEDGFWVEFDIAVRGSGSETELLNCMIEYGSSSSAHQF